MRIRVSTRFNLYDQRKREHVERGYRIEEEQPIPVNGLCSFVVVREESGSDRMAALVAQAIGGERQ